MSCAREPRSVHRVLRSGGTGAKVQRGSKGDPKDSQVQRGLATVAVVVVGALVAGKKLAQLLGVMKNYCGSL